MNLSSVPARCKKEPVLGSQPVLKNLPLFLPAVRRNLSSGLSTCIKEPAPVPASYKKEPLDYQPVLKNLPLFLPAIRRNLSSGLSTCIKEPAPVPASCNKEPVLCIIHLY
jgi:hypothetical protein